MKKFFVKNKYILIIFIVLALYFAYVLISQEIKYKELIDDRENYTLEIDELKLKINELYNIIEVISTPEYIEKMAREKLQMVKPDEIIYILEDNNNWQLCKYDL